MKVTGEGSIAGLIRIVLEAAWWLLAVGLAALTGLLLLSFFVNLDGNNLTMDLPVALELDAAVHGGTASAPADGQIEKVRANLRFPVRSGAFLSASTSLLMLLFGFLLCLLSQLRHVFRSFSRGLLFVPENAQRIRWVGFAVVVGELARAAAVYFWSYYTSLHFTANGLRFVASTDLSGIAIIGGLAIVVIAEVLREATRLHEEQSLTI